LTHGPDPYQDHCVGLDKQTVIDSPKRRAWERQPNEIEEHWMAFLVYRDMGLGRSVAAAGRAVGLRKDAVYKLSRSWDWRKRVALWDKWRHDTAQTAMAEEIKAGAKQMVRTQIRHARLMQKLGLVELKRWMTLLEVNTKHPDTKKRPSIPLDQLRALLDMAHKLERLARDKPIEIHDHRHSAEKLNFDNLTMDELKQFRALREKALAAGDEPPKVIDATIE